jgi:acyl carrier protein
MVVRDDLIEFLNRTLKDLNVQLDSELRDDTSLLQSGLLDSMAILSLVGWIEEETGASLDLMTIEITKEWDTIADILEFCNTSRQRG